VRNIWKLRGWALVAAFAALVAKHALLLYAFFSHTTVGVAAGAGLIALVFVKHVSALGPLAFLRRRSNAAKREPIGSD
jgi:hypothetical protein